MLCILTRNWRRTQDSHRSPISPHSFPGDEEDVRTCAIATVGRHAGDDAGTDAHPAPAAPSAGPHLAAAPLAAELAMPPSGDRASVSPADAPAAAVVGAHAGPPSATLAYSRQCAALLPLSRAQQMADENTLTAAERTRLEQRRDRLMKLLKEGDGSAGSSNLDADDRADLMQEWQRIDNLLQRR
jgi:hypothetical protein